MLPIPGVSIKLIDIVTKHSEAHVIRCRHAEDLKQKSPIHDLFGPSPARSHRLCAMRFAARD